LKSRENYYLAVGASATSANDTADTV